MKEVEDLKKEVEWYLNNKGKVLFLYLDGVIEKLENEEINLSDLLIQEGLGYSVEKDYNEIDCFINNDLLNEKQVGVKATNSMTLPELFGFYDIGQNLVSEDEAYQNFGDDAINVKVDKIKIVKEYRW
jgi:hypothetical protein